MTAPMGEFMSTLGLIEYRDASPEVRAVYDDIMATRKTDWINNFWKALAHDPATLRRTWQSVTEIMARSGRADQRNDLRRRQRHESMRLLHRIAHRRGPQGGDDRRDVGRSNGRSR